jgi:hypothetical protein
MRPSRLRAENSPSGAVLRSAILEKGCDLKVSCANLRLDSPSAGVSQTPPGRWEHPFQSLRFGKPLAKESGSNWLCSKTVRQTTPPLILSKK